jgi:hypothetical protein
MSMQTERSVSHAKFYLAILILGIIGFSLFIAGSYLTTILNAKLDPLRYYIALAIQDAGPFLGVSAVIALIGERITQFDIVKRFAQEVAENVAENVFKGIFGVRASGLCGVLSGIDLLQLFDEMRPTDELYIVVTYLTQPAVRLRHAAEAVRRGARIRILFMSPNSPSIALRAIENSMGASYKLELEAFVNALTDIQKTLRNENCNTLEVAEYDDLIGSPIYLLRRDEKPYLAYSSIYLDRQTTVDFPNFRWENVGTSSVIHDLDRFVHAKWERSFRP